MRRQQLIRLKDLHISNSAQTNIVNRAINKLNERIVIILEKIINEENSEVTSSTQCKVDFTMDYST